MKQHIPNTLSILRLLLALCVGVLAFLPGYTLLVQALIVSAIVSDKMDGSLARFWGVESELGKKLESLVDPLLGCTSVLYLVMQKDLPLWFVIYSGSAFVLVSLFRALVSMRSGGLFYEKSPLTRYGVGVLYILILLYLFSAPYREWWLAGATLVGTAAAINYCRLLLSGVHHKANQ